MAILSETSKVSNAGEVQAYKVFNDTVTDETKSDAILVWDALAVTLFIETAASTSGGVVELEAAMTSDYAGTWESLGSITTNAASSAFSISIGLGSNNETGYPGLPQMYVRARVSTVIADGSIDAYIIVRK